MPESPRWLVKNGQRDRALGVLARLGGASFAAQAVADIESTLVNEIRKVNFRDLLEPGVRRIVGFGVLLAFIVQWCGINVIFYYTKDVFAAAGYNVSAILLNIIIVGATNLVFTFVALQTVDKLGRRPLTLAGWAGLTVIFVMMGWCFHAKVTGLPVVLLVMLAIGWYASTIAPMCWVTLAEIFPNRSAARRWPPRCSPCGRATSCLPICSHHARKIRHGRNLLGFRRHLRTRLRPHEGQAARNQGQDARGDRARTGGLNHTP